MDTKLEARGQFPASFPDTFKNFFAMMNEDEDHVGLFANLLEDKVIPRQNSPVQPQRQRYGGSMRSHSGGDRSDRRGRAERQYQQQLQNQQQQQQQRGYQSRSRSGSGSGVDLFANRNVSFSNSSSRVNSLRRNRSRGSLTLSSNGLNALGLGPVTLAPNVSSSSSGSVLDLTVPGASVIGDPGGEVRDGIEGREGRDGRGGLGGSRSNLYPSPSKTSLKPSLKTSTSTVERGCALFLGIDGNLPCHHLKSCYHDLQHDHSTDGLQHLQQQLKGQQPGTSQKHVTLACCECVCGSSKAARSGPDGEDNCGANYPKGYAGGYMLPSTPKSKTIDKTSTYTSAELAASKNKNLQERQERQEKRGSVILERAFDFDASCDESDSISSSTHNPVPSPAPHQPAYNVLKPILKQPQQKTMLQQQQQQQQHQQTVNVQQNQGANHQQYQQVAHQHHQGVALQQQQHQVVTHQPHQQQVNQQDYDQVNHQQHQQVSHQQNQQVNHQQHQQVIHQQHQGVNQQQMIHQQHQMVTHPPHHHQQVAHQQLPTPGVHVHRLLPTPPTHSGKGAFHTREAALQRVQQQSGYYNQGPSTSASAYGYNQSMEHQQMQQQLQYDQHQHQQDLQFEQHQTPHQARQLYSDDTELDYDTEWELDEEPAPEIVPPLSTFSDFVNAAQNPTGSRQSLRAQKSPILNRRRASSIAGNLLHSDYNYTRNSIGGAPIDSNDFQRISHSSSARDRMSLAGVLTFQQAMSGAVSPQYGTVGSLNPQASGSGEKKPGMVGADAMGGGGLPGGSSHNINLTVGLGFLGGSNTTLAAVAEVTSGPDGNGDSTDSPSPVSMIPSKQQQQQQQQQQQKQQQLLELQMQQEREDLPTHLPMKRERGVGESSGASTSGTAIADLAASVVLASHSGKPLTERQRLRTSSMPAESRRPRLAEMRRSAIHAGDPDMTYYRLRSFSITSHGICNLGDSLRSRRSRSINSVTSTGTSNSGVDRHNSNASGASGEVIDGDPNVPAYKIAMLGGSGVGKTTLTYQFTTSDYICAYDLSLDDDYGQKTVSVLVDNIETDLEIIDHPACEMSTEAFCATYNIDLFVVVYSVIDRNTFAAAERVLQYLKENEMLLSRGAILVANKTDLQRHRVVTRQMGRKVAKDIACKFIETSSGLDHNVDELLVGIVAQVKLNPQRLRLLTELELQRLNLQSTIQKHRGMHLQSRRMVRQMSICQGDEEIFDGGLSERLQNDDENNDPDGVPSTSRASRSRIENPNRKPLNLESILKMGESEVDDDEDVVKTSQLSKFNMLAATIRHRRPFRKRRSFDGGVSTSAAADAAAELQRRYQLRAMDDLQLEGRLAAEDRFGDRNGGLAESEDEEAGEDGVVEDGRRNTCNRKVVKKLTARTKVFISSVLRFKKSISLKRRNSSSCSDLFVI
ncbi:uncharacterized protein LOC108110389 isoform X3 [Drosophila eugracilis]|uniref:uncharacterized protein LOC108110389 isoform X3 n=1 Tax=Drosophila eugracilis TaxID=29029 RepID=UPI0007E7A711|nr:uncharacterized protein LOC108110389 isoform X3 [Drosophila eugracilis]